MSVSQTEARLRELASAPAAKPLYLDPAERATVTLDGPALRITVPGQADRHVPLRRLSRIVATRRTELSTGALLACADRGISILLVDEAGEVGARILGRPGERQEIRQRLLDLLERADWRDCYRAWLRAEQRRLQLYLQWRLRIPVPAGPYKEVLAWVERTATRLAGADSAARSQLWLRQLVESWMLNHLAQLGLGAPSELLVDGWPDLPSDLADLLSARLEPLRLGFLRRRRRWAEEHSRPLRPTTRRDLIWIFEHHAARVSRAGRELTNRLHRWLIEMA